MDDALSYRVLLAVVALLSRITPAKEFHNDFSDVWSVEDRNVNEVRGITGYVREGDDFQVNETSTTQRQRAGSMQVLIELAIPLAANQAALIAHNARDDIVNALDPSAIALPKGATGLAIEDRRILTRPDGANCIVVQVIARTGLVEKVRSAPQSE